MHATRSKLLTMEELARTLNVGQDLIRRAVKEERIPAIRLTPRTLRFDLDEVLDALRQPAQREGDDGRD